jgi:hypothetical protein
VRDCFFICIYYDNHFFYEMECAMIQKIFLLLFVFSSLFHLIGVPQALPEVSGTTIELMIPNLPCG